MEKTEQIHGTIKVAYAEDHTAVRKGIISLITASGTIEVIIEAANGKELIEKTAAAGALPDVCMIDINMPEMNGFDTVAAIRRRWKGMKILVLSTYTEDLYIIRMIRAGVNGFLAKTCSPDEIKQALIEIHNNGKYYSESFVEKAFLTLQDAKFQIPDISAKEVEFLKLCCSDMTYSQIAARMKCTLKSVEGFRDSLFKKLGMNSRVSLALYAVKSGIILMEDIPVR